MGAINRPSGDRRKMIDEALRDLDPSIRETVWRLIDNYRGDDLEKKLAELVGYDWMRKIVDMK